MKRLSNILNSSLIMSWFLPIVVSLVLIFDQITKQLIVTKLNEFESIELIPNIFYFTYIQNTGIAFGLFKGSSWPLLIVILLGVGVLFYLAYKIRREPLLFQLGISFVLGGALGNLVDRFYRGAVVDFLDFKIWPVFNIADSFITIGVTILVFAILRQKR